jgi:uroporphyrin-3 C-methyltransferase/uroporphyrinogen III methyltransferase/synthase
MTDMHNSPDASPPPSPPAPLSEPVVADIPQYPPRPRQRLIHVVLVVLALLLVAQWWMSHREIASLRKEVARRMQGSDTANTETRVVAKSVQETTQELQAKVSVLENKQAEAQSQQVALEQLYQDMFKKREDWALSEIEQMLSTASEQLQLAGNVQGALIALQAADSRLSHAETPQFVSVRRAIGHDIERLKSLPSVDITGITLRLDSVIGQIDSLPLLAAEQPAPPAAEPKNMPEPAPPKKAKAHGKATKPAEETPVAALTWTDIAKAKWDSWSSEMWTEVQQLIRIRKVDTPDALLLSPTEAYYVRENLKLRLLSARLALLSRNEAAFRSDLIAAQDAITRYFDTRARQTQTVQTMLKQVQATNLAVEMPTLSESLNAVRNYKPRP